MLSNCETRIVIDGEKNIEHHLAKNAMSFVTLFSNSVCTRIRNNAYGMLGMQMKKNKVINLYLFLKKSRQVKMIIVFNTKQVKKRILKASKTFLSK